MSKLESVINRNRDPLLCNFCVEEKEKSKSFKSTFSLKYHVTTQHKNNDRVKDSLEKEKIFCITYDEIGKGERVSLVTHKQFQSNPKFRQSIKKLECRWCGFKSEFTEDSS